MPRKVVSFSPGDSHSPINFTTGCDNDSGSNYLKPKQSMTLRSSRSSIKIKQEGNGCDVVSLTVKNADQNSRDSDKLKHSFEEMKERNLEDVPLRDLMKREKENKLSSSGTKLRKSVGSEKSIFGTPSVNRNLRPRRSLNFGSSNTVNMEIVISECKTEESLPLALNMDLVSIKNNEVKSSPLLVDSPQAENENNEELSEKSENTDIVSKDIDMNCSISESDKKVVTGLEEVEDEKNNVLLSSQEEFTGLNKNISILNSDSSETFQSIISDSITEPLLNEKVEDFEKNVESDSVTSSPKEVSWKQPFVGNVFKSSPPQKLLDITYSPMCYSPGTGILRKRKFCDNTEANYSPSSKIRRVAFSEIVATVEIPNRFDTKRTSSLECAYSSVTDRNGGKEVEHELERTKRSNLPVFPDLIGATNPIEDILPRLTYSTWVRGLKSLLAAKGVVKIGDLASMSEIEVESLPFPQPKSQKVKDALQSWKNDLNKKMSKSAIMTSIQATVIAQDHVQPVCRASDADEDVSDHIVSDVGNETEQIQSLDLDEQVDVEHGDVIHFDNAAVDNVCNEETTKDKVDKGTETLSNTGMTNLMDRSTSDLLAEVERRTSQLSAKDFSKLEIKLMISAVASIHSNLATITKELF